MKAIILAAGMGKRLRPLTDSAPKPLTEINGKSIMENSLEILQKCGIKESIIVLGYLGKKIVNCFGDNFMGMKLRYINNDIYDKTNNIYSVWLARKYLNDDILLIDGDVLYEDRLIKVLLNSPYENCAAIDHYNFLLDGLVVNLTEDGLIAGMYFKTDPKNSDFSYSDKFKTANIYKLSQSFLSGKYLKQINKKITQGDVNIFHGVAFKEILESGGTGELFMKGVIMKGIKWFEIDTVQDVKIAERVFEK